LIELVRKMAAETAVTNQKEIRHRCYGHSLRASGWHRRREPTI